jgi:hypothetical protein
MHAAKPTGGPCMLRTTVLAVFAAVVVPLALAAGAAAAPDPIGKSPRSRVTTAPAQPAVRQVAEAARPMQAPMAVKDLILYTIITDQIREMRRKSALPATMCVAESNGDGTAEPVSRNLMARLEADNAQIENSLFTLKHVTECRSNGQRIADRDTHQRAMLILAGPMETEMKGLMTGCGDFVGGFIRASGDSDFDFYTVNGGDVARKLGCELAH